MHSTYLITSWESQIIRQDAGHTSPSFSSHEDGSARHGGFEDEPQSNDGPTDVRSPTAYRPGDADRHPRPPSSVPDVRRWHHAASAAPYGVDQDRSPPYDATSFTQPPALDDARQWSRPSRSSSRSSRRSSPPPFAHGYANDPHHVSAFQAPLPGPSSSSWQLPPPQAMSPVTRPPPHSPFERYRQSAGGTSMPPFPFSSH
jgi:hypothetical protein